jgi:predicted ATP-dependent endonuclease of OLD family
MIRKIKMENFTLFKSFDVEFSPSLNVIIGENSTGKTHLIKLLYSIIKSYETVHQIDKTKSKFSNHLTKEIIDNFMVDSIGRLSSRIQGHKHTKIELFLNKEKLEIEFSTRSKELAIKEYKDIEVKNSIYLPTKEILSIFKNFISNYEEGKIEIEKLYRDLAIKLAKNKTHLNSDKKALIKNIENIMKAEIIYDDKEEKFYVKQKGIGNLEIGLVSEGFRKIGTLLHLIANGTLSNNSILFWDEPEVNMNPKFAENISKLLVELSKRGMQIFIVTHDYFLMRYLSFEAKRISLNTKFISLYKEKNTDKFIKFEVEDELDDLEHNSIIESIEKIYELKRKSFYNG